MRTQDYLGVTVRLNPKMGYSKWWCRFKFIIITCIQDGKGELQVRVRMYAAPRTKKQRAMDGLWKPVTHFITTKSNNQP